MKCELCGAETSALVEHGSGGKTLRICRACLKKEPDAEDCRCKESIGKTPAEIGRMILDDLKFWKKRGGRVR